MGRILISTFALLLLTGNSVVAQQGWFRIAESAPYVSELVVVSADTVYLFGLARPVKSFLVLKSVDGGLTWQDAIACDSCFSNQDEHYVDDVGLFVSALTDSFESSLFFVPNNTDSVVPIPMPSGVRVTGDITFFDRYNGYVLGTGPESGGASFSLTSDAGATWETRILTLGHKSSPDFFEFKDSLTGIVTISSPPEFNYSATLRTSDACKTWIEIEPQANEFSHYKGDQWYGCDPWLTASSDNGRTWSSFQPGLRCDKLRRTYSQGVVTASSLTSPTPVVFTEDGTGWRVMKPPPRVDVAYVVDSLIAYAISEGAVWKTTSGGHVSGVDHQQENTQSLFTIANPAKDEIRVELNVASSAEISVFNALGVEVVKTGLDKIDVSDLAGGVYYVRVASAGSVETRRIVVAK
jgi:hypothetical protein